MKRSRLFHLTMTRLLREGPRVGVLALESDCLSSDPSLGSYNLLVTQFFHL